MGIEKSFRFKGIRTGIVVIAVMVIFMASALPVYAAPEQFSETRQDEGTDSGKSTVEYKEERIEEIPYKTLYQYSSDLAWNESIISVEGETGTKKVVGKVITEDGKITERRELAEIVIKEATDEVILIGSLDALPETNYTFEDGIPWIGVVYDPSVYVSLPDKEKGDDAGKEIVEYALQFLGNPYVWGGTDLLYGCDCSGFVCSVFRNLGYDVPRNYYAYTYPISVDEMRPGDVITYPHHYAIYIGGGMEVSALNEYQGICITPVGYVDSYYMAVRIAKDK